MVPAPQIAASIRSAHLSTPSYTTGYYPVVAVHAWQRRGAMPILKPGIEPLGQLSLTLDATPGQTTLIRTTLAGVAYQRQDIQAVSGCTSKKPESIGYDPKVTHESSDARRQLGV
ncbi:hypothetical protein LA080_010563 [Diaporthe eres]|nr:hypothetical protein LA080_010563 [Diaporthe eres]